MNNKVEQIRVIKVENGYVVTATDKSFVALNEDGVKELITTEIPRLLEVLNKKEETKDAIRSEPTTAAETEIPTAG